MNKRRLKKLYDKIGRDERLTGTELEVAFSERLLRRIEKIRRLPSGLWTSNRRGLGQYVNVQGRIFHADLFTAARWFECADRHVAQDFFDDKKIEVSTVFMTFDHNWLDDGAPVLWETMIFRNGGGSETWRATSEQEAREQHKEACLVAQKKEVDTNGM